MLAYFLALVVGLGSLAIYLTAFFFPEIHRKNDFIWSGVGLFYALVLWVFAPRITGGLLLGHVASVALLVWLGWQALTLRRQLTPQAQQTPIPSSEAVKANIHEQMSKFSLPERLGQLQNSFSSTLSGVKERVQQIFTRTPPVEVSDHPNSEQTPYNPPTPELGVETPAQPQVPTSELGVETPAQPQVPTSELGVETPAQPQVPTSELGVETPAQPQVPTSELGVETPAQPQVPTSELGAETPAQPQVPTSELGVETPAQPQAPTSELGVETPAQPQVPDNQAS